MLVPGLNYKFESLVRSVWMSCESSSCLQVECTSEMGVADQVRVFVSRKERTQPILTALINMPVSEMV